MSLWFDEPVVALLALGVMLVTAGLATYARRRGRSVRWSMAGVVLPLGAAALMGLALARPIVSVARGEAGRVVILLDLSASTRRSPWRDPAWVRDLARRRLSPTANKRVTVVGFASRPVVIMEDVGVNEPGEWPARWPAMEADGDTDVEAALRWRTAGELATPGQPALVPRWIITDGLGANPRDVPECAVGVTVVKPGVVDVGVRQMMTRWVKEGVEILVEVAATGKMEGELEVRRDGVSLARVPVGFPEAAGRGGGGSTRWVTVRDASGESRHVYEAVVRKLPEADPWPENDGGAVEYVSAGARRILRIGRTQDGSVVSGVDWVRTEDFAEDAAQLSRRGYQAVVLEDVPAEVIASIGRSTGAPVQTEAQVRAPPAAGAQSLDRFVRQTGAGLLILGEGHAFGPGLYGQGSATGKILEQLSPVRSSPPRSADFHLILVLDASGSMNEAGRGVEGAVGAMEPKFKVLARGAVRAAEMLPPEDRLTVITFNGSARTLATGRASDVLGKMAEELARVEPTGPTNPDAALDLLDEALKEDGPRRRLVVLLTDGEIPALDVARWKGIFADPRNHLAIVAPAPDPISGAASLRLGVELGPAATWLPTANSERWAGLLREVISAEMRGREMDTPLKWRSEGIEPRLEGNALAWTQVWEKREAQLRARGAAGEILGAVAQRGLGKVAALAMRDETDAGRRMVEELLKEVMAVAGDRRFTLAARPDLGRIGGGWLLMADGVDGDKFLDHESLAARIFAGGDFSEVMVPMVQTGPGHYEALVAEGRPFSVVVVRRGGATQATGGEEREELVGRIQPARVAVREYPATVEAGHGWGAGAVVPAGSVGLPADPRDGLVWTPRAVAWRIGLGPYLWFAAAVACLTALYLRRMRGSRSAMP